MRSVKVVFGLFICFTICEKITASPLPYPDSAGIVEMPPGLAYGGIPYGSVTGKVADFYGVNPRSIAALTGGTPGQHGQPLRPVYHTQ